MSRDPIAIFTCKLLPPSETFVRAQAEGLLTYTPYYVGYRRAPGLSLPEERTLVVNSRGGVLGVAAEAGFKFLGFAPRIMRHLRQIKPRLIHAHFGLGGALALPLARRLKVPLLVTFHGSDATTPDEVMRGASHTHRIYLRRRRKLARYASVILAVSDFVKRRLAQIGFPSEKIVVHHIGVDTAFFQPDPQQPRCPVVLFVGRLVEQKGCEYLIRAMERVQAQHPSAALRIIGDGPLRPRLEALAASSLRQCTFLGGQPPESVREELNRASVFCVPSFSEGFGLVFTEAQSMGTPVVSFRSGGIPEAVAHGESGFLVPERDVDGLAEHVLRLLREPELWRSVSDAGQKLVRRKFDLRTQNQRLEHIYRSVLGAGADVNGAAACVWREATVGDEPVGMVSPEH